ncbi:MAG: putative capsular polysaccharide synthesis family protein [Dissulfuribacterales bacterium]
MRIAGSKHSIWNRMVQGARIYIQGRLKQVYYGYRINLRHETPVIVYQMGKVGSSSISKSLAQQQSNPVFHIHRMNLQNINDVYREHKTADMIPPDESLGILLNKHIIKKNRPAKIITLVREPIERNMSAFFQNYERFVGQRYNKSIKDVDGLIQRFFDAYNHTVPLTWFDIEMKTVLDIDVFQHPFPYDKGYAILERLPYELLILKLETEEAVKAEAVGKFLNIANFKLSRHNIGEHKVYSKTYKEFKRHINVPKGYVDKMCKSKYMRHFYSSEEIEAIRRKWLL